MEPTIGSFITIKTGKDLTALVEVIAIHRDYITGTVGTVEVRHPGVKTTFRVSPTRIV